MNSIRCIHRLTSNDSTIKFVLSLYDNNIIECSYFYLDYRSNKHVFCISSQVGCPADCKFCENSNNKFLRNISPDELIGQFEIMTESVKIGLNGIFDISFMGIGEPLLNLNNLLVATSQLRSKEPNLGKINISSIGIPLKIRELARANTHNHLGIHLQISLNAPSDNLRYRLMPYASKIARIDELLTALDYYQKKTNEIYCLNYLMLDGINDSRKHAKDLVNISTGRNTYIKLTLLNNTYSSIENRLKGSTQDSVDEFMNYLIGAGIEIKLFKGNGLDINASCGQCAYMYQDSLTKHTSNLKEKLHLREFDTVL